VDLTVRILQEIRDEQRGMRADMREMRADIQAMTARADVRFEVIETTLRDLAQQLVVLGRAVKVAIDDRREGTDRWEDHERRIADLERRAGGH